MEWTAKFIFAKKWDVFFLSINFYHQKISSSLAKEKRKAGEEEVLICLQNPYKHSKIIPILRQSKIY